MNITQCRLCAGLGAHEIDVPQHSLRENIKQCVGIDIGMGNNLTTKVCVGCKSKIEQILRFVRIWEHGVQCITPKSPDGLHQCRLCAAFDDHAENLFEKGFIMLISEILGIEVRFYLFSHFLFI